MKPIIKNYGTYLRESGTCPESDFNREIGDFYGVDMRTLDFPLDDEIEEVGFGTGGCGQIESEERIVDFIEEECWCPLFIIDVLRDSEKDWDLPGCLEVVSTAMARSIGKYNRYAVQARADLKAIREIVGLPPV